MSTREKIIQEAERLLRQEGLAGLSLRKVAKAAGIQAPSIYEHFDSKEAVLDQVRQRVMVQVLERFQEARGMADSPLEQLVEAGAAYVRFAREEQAVFQLFFSVFRSQRTELDQPEPGQSPYTVLRRLVVAYATPHIGNQFPQTFDEIAYGYWSLIHGAALLQSTFLAGFQADFDAADRNNFRRYLMGSIAGLGTSTTREGG